VDAADTLYLQPRDFTGTPQALDTPEGFYPTTGVNSLTADTSEAQGAKILDGAITGRSPAATWTPQTPSWFSVTRRAPPCPPSSWEIHLPTCCNLT
jgi:hypothetical protein